MTGESKTYPVFDHDQHGHAAPDIEPGRVFFDEDKGKVVCSEHGDKCATDGSATRTVAEAPLEFAEDGTPVQRYDKIKEVGQARLYRCTVCGQGSWSHKA